MTKKDTDLSTQQRAWLHAADVMEDALERCKGVYSAEGVALRRRFIDDVRARNGEGIDEIYAGQFGQICTEL